MLDFEAAAPDVAIVGMACIFPGAPDLASFWKNIVERVDAVGEPPDDWRADLFFDPQSNAGDKVYCKSGGYLRELAAFNPLEYGVMPSSIDGGEPDHFLALRVAHEAFADAGYLGENGRAFDGDRVEVILGRGVYINRAFTSLVQHSLVVDQTLRLLTQLHPEHSVDALHRIREALKASLPAFNAEIAPGLVPNVLSGRIANRLDLKGPNFTVDAACASSLIAVDHGVQDLLAGRCDMALVGGVQCSTPAPIHMIFCQLNALSRRGTIRPFDADADGTVLGEGLGMMVLKRSADARRDGDRVYAVIKGVGSASDGRALGLLAPRPEGQELAMRRAYAAAGVDPSSIGLIEAHGTGTAVGDQTEAETLTRVFGQRHGRLPSCALGTVKSMIGHLLPAAGIAGMIKAALALHHKILPPTLHCEQPNGKLGLEATPLYINGETRPWVHGLPTPRRAGVNAFGFGGINAHVILGEATPAPAEIVTDGAPGWDSEVVIPSAASRDGLIEASRRLLEFLATPTGRSADLASIAYSVNCTSDGDFKIAIVAASVDDLTAKLERGMNRLRDPGCTAVTDPAGIYYSEARLGTLGKVAFLFPGEGSQYLHMLADVCMRSPVVRERFDLIDRAFGAHARNVVPSQVIFPPALPDDPATRQAHEQRLVSMDFAAEAVFAGSQGIFALLTALNVRPDAVVGHSGGEISALLASGTIRAQDDAGLVEHIIEANELYERLVSDGLVPAGAAVAVNATERSKVLAAIREFAPDVQLAIDNCPNQVVLCGSETAVGMAVERLRADGALCLPLPFQRPYHTAAFEPYCARTARFFDRLDLGPGQIPVWSAAAARLFPHSPDEIRRLASRQSALPVRFRETVEAMHDDGTRVFVEIGPGGTLTSFVGDTLRGRQHVAIATNLPRISGIRQLNVALGQLAVHGVPLCLAPLYQGRGARTVPLESSVPPDTGGAARPKPMPLAMGLSYLHLSNEIAATTREAKISPTPSFAEPHAEAPAGVSPASPTAPPPGPRFGNGSSIGQAMKAYLASMDKFLAVEGAVMRRYLEGADPADGGEGPPGPGSDGFEVPRRQGSRDHALEPPEHLAGRGLSLLADSEIVTPPIDELAVPAKAHDVKTIILEVISERTGYPPDMLAPTLDLEADLGIDSIKRIEILAAVHRRTGRIGSDRMDAASSLKTINQIVAFVDGEGEGGVKPGAVPPVVSPVEAGATRPRDFPLLGEIASQQPGMLVATRSVSTDEDRFLNDHALGGYVSVTDPALTGLPVMPLTMTIEMMAEAAASLVPGKKVVELRGIWASHWLAFDRGRLTLRVMAELQPPTGPIAEVKVRVDLSEAGSDGRSPRLFYLRGTDDTKVAECVAVLADHYPEPPSAAIKLASPRASKWQREQLYRDHMFHGPCFRGIEAMELWAQNGSRAALRVLPRSRLFAKMPAPAFIIDPVLLDAAGQMVGYWAAEHLATGFNVFPYRLQSLQVFAPVLPEGQSLTCNANIRLDGDTRITADLDIATPGGRTVMRATGWEDLRIDFPEAFYRMCVSPDGVMLTSPQALPAASEDVSGTLCCRTLDLACLPSFESHGAIWLRTLAQLVLSRREREIWEGLKVPPSRRAEWLLGRCCAKDGVRILARDAGDRALMPADIDIAVDENGRPMIDQGCAVAFRPSISIAHSDGLAVALVSRESDVAVGIDVERIDARRDGFEEAAFTPGELALIAQAGARSSGFSARDGEVRREYALRLWCAKEAVGKALGLGLAAGPGTVLASAFDAVSGTARLTIADCLVGGAADPARWGASPTESAQVGLARAALARSELLAHTSRENDRVMALCVYRRLADGTI